MFKTKERFAREQGYVFHAANQFGTPAKIVEHSRPTTTCQEKAALLGWDIRRTIKTLYLTDGSDYVSVITPETTQLLSLKHILIHSLEISGSQAKKYRFGDVAPFGMMPGTCSPFPPLRSPPKKIILLDEPTLDDILVDVSIGGTTPGAKQVSLQLFYGTLKLVLQDTFPKQYILN